MLVFLPLSAFPLILALALLFVLVIPRATFAGPLHLQVLLGVVHAVGRMLIALLAAAGLWFTMTVAGNVFQGTVMMKTKPAAVSPAIPPRPEMPA